MAINKASPLLHLRETALLGTIGNIDDLIGRRITTSHCRPRFVVEFAPLGQMRVVESGTPVLRPA
jgi:hypothetical protein